MKLIPNLLIALVLGMASFATTALAADSDPLFINLTTDDPHRAHMAISFGQNQHDLGHSLTIFLNDRGVLIGSKAESNSFEMHQTALADLIEKGATVLVCPMCMKHHGVKESDLLPGMKIGNPELTGSYLFGTGTRTLTW